MDSDGGGRPEHPDRYDYDQGRGLPPPQVISTNMPKQGLPLHGQDNPLSPQVFYTNNAQEQGLPPPAYQSFPETYTGPPQPIVSQPISRPQDVPGGWMNTPQAPLNCPPGLEYLAQIDQLLVHQKIELLEVVTGFETNNQYNIKNSLGQQVYFAKEDTDCLTRNCCGPIRPFDMKIFDNFRNEVIHLYRPLACNNCCFPCCLQSIEISAPPGNLIGVVQQEWSLCIPIFSVKNANYETVLRIEGPFCTISCCGDVDFEVTAIDGETQVGKITKQWSGLVREMFTDSDHFGVTFPIDLDVKMKAVLLGALFLIDMMFFEKTGNN
jgi:hypothetical protein